MYRERLQREPAKYRALYIDYQFLIREMFKAKRFYQDLYPDRDLQLPSLDVFIRHAIGWLHEKSFITGFVFVPPEEAYYIRTIDGKTAEYENGEIRINVMPYDLYTIELGVHMESFAHLFNELFLVADDPVYVPPFRAVLPANFTENSLGSQNFDFLRGGKLLRKGNDETAFVGTDLAKVPWQDVCYPIGTAMGLDLREL